MLGLTPFLPISLLELGLPWNGILQPKNTLDLQPEKKQLLFMVLGGSREDCNQAVFE